MSTIASSASIHPMAVVEDGAIIGENVKIGPFCHVGPRVVLGDDVELLAHSVVMGITTIGKGTKIFPMAVIGGDPQSVHHGGEETTLSIGDNCTMREGVTINTGTADFGGKTIVGNNNLFLANSHVAHDCRVGNNVIMSNNVMLAGHVVIEDRVILGGGCGRASVHPRRQACLRRRPLGCQLRCHSLRYAERQSGPAGWPQCRRHDTRSGVDRATIHVVRRAYKAIFEGEGNVRDNAAAIREEFADCEQAVQILDFIAADSDRALSSPTGDRRGDPCLRSVIRQKADWQSSPEAAFCRPTLRGSQECTAKTR
jgi:UDP-N-acetylglucosamine acyltransferase